MSLRGKRIERVRFRIERACEEDAADLAQLHAEALPPGWEPADFAKSCADKQRILWKAVEESPPLGRAPKSVSRFSDGGRALGLLVLQHAAGEGEILTLAVGKRARCQRVASALVGAAAGACQALGIEALYLEVAETNAPALGLYEKAGFKTIARRENYYRLARSAPESALIMRLDTKALLTQIHPLVGKA
jgi:[ribosomal protein S18]-alanine N-acetyltransferase